jgi:hypothetical protein
MVRSAVFCARVFIAGLALGQTVSPKRPLTAAEQAMALKAIREYALSYTRNLPNYTCTQTTRQTVAREEFGPIPRPRADVIEE